MIRLLDGVRVLDMSRLIPGAYATVKLADLGADVIKLEQGPTGDYLRQVPPQVDDLGLFYLQLNRNKRSVEVDLNTDSGRAAFQELVKSADVFLEAGRPGAAAHSGFGYEQLREMKPDIIYCSLSGFGQDGPYAALPAHGAQMEAVAGGVVIEGADGPRAEPPNLRTFNASQSGGLHAALAIAAALVQRDRSGEGAYLDVSCWASAVSWQYGNLVCLANTGELFPGSQGMGARYGCYRTLDGGWLMIGLLEPKFWRTFCLAVDRPELVGAETSDAINYGDDEKLAEELAAIFVGRDRKEWVSFAVEHQLPIAPVLSPQDLLDDEHMQAQEMLVESSHPGTGRPISLVGLPIRVAGQHFEIERLAPAFGADTNGVK